MRGYRFRTYPIMRDPHSPVTVVYGWEAQVSVGVNDRTWQDIGHGEVTSEKKAREAALRACDNFDAAWSAEWETI